MFPVLYLCYKAELLTFCQLKIVGVLQSRSAVIDALMGYATTAKPGRVASRINRAMICDPAVQGRDWKIVSDM
jgi:hypothetical protein